MKRLICVLLLTMFAVAVSAQQAQAPAHKVSAAEQAKIQEAIKRQTDARIALELARRELDAANEHLGSVVNGVRADNGWSESKFEASLDKDGVLVFTEKRAAGSEGPAGSKALQPSNKP